MLAAELRERRAGGEAACRAVLALDGDAMPVRMGRWMQAALSERAERPPARALSPIELEVLQRELGVGASERIATLVAARGVRKGRGCATTIELLDAMARLRGPQRQLAVRLMLQTPS